MNEMLTDLHTHILPGVDDGAANLEESLQMLRLQKEKGVGRVALTPHFYPLREELDGFLKKRQRSYELLMTGWDPETMPQLKLGAEVHYSVRLAEMDLKQLTVGGGRYLLLELSDSSVPAHIEQVMKLILEQGIRPVLAHVERCAYFRDDPKRLVNLIDAGALAQLSMKAFEKKDRRNFARICLERNAAHILASDIHDVKEDNAWLCNASRNLSQDALDRAESFARMVWDDKDAPSFKVSPIKKRLFGYG